MKKIFLLATFAIMTGTGLLYAYNKNNNSGSCCTKGCCTEQCCGSGSCDCSCGDECTGSGCDCGCSCCN